VALLYPADLTGKRLGGGGGKIMGGRNARVRQPSTSGDQAPRAGYRRPTREIEVRGHQERLGSSGKQEEKESLLDRAPLLGKSS